MCVGCSRKATSGQHVVNSLGGLGFAMKGRVAFVTAELKSSERRKSRGRRINYQMLNLI